MAAEGFATFYDYFLFTKSWAYALMFVTLPAFVVYWNCILYPCSCKDKKECDSQHD